MNPFKFYVPTRLVIEVGCVSSLGTMLAKQGVKSALIVTDRGVMKAGCVSKVLSSLEDSGIGHEVYDGVEQNPSEENVKEALAMLSRNGYGTIVAVGGGSAIDTAKAVVAMIIEKVDIRDLYSREVVGKAPIILVAVPTTAGTGSEVTRSAVITNKEARVKETIRGECLYPKIALVDPELTISLPRSITASTGMDAFTHAIEAYTTLNAHALSDALAIEATRLIFANLRKAVSDGSDIEARSNMCVASTLAGMAFSISGLGMVHAMAEPLGGRFNVPHGVANSILLPYCLSYNCDAMSKKLAFLARVLGLRSSYDEEDSRSVEDAAVAVVEAVRKLSADVGIPHRIQKVTVTKMEFNDLVGDALKNSCLLANPKKASREDLKRTYAMVLDVE
jgi:alcohol dehydrogenase class IV